MSGLISFQNCDLSLISFKMKIKTPKMIKSRDFDHKIFLHCFSFTKLHFHSLYTLLCDNL